jgi:glucose-1-phosphate cytidylyltransferase
MRSASESRIIPHKSSNHENFKVTLVDTGPETMTGGRIKQIEKYIDSDNFMLTYGDGVADIDINALYDFHLKNDGVATVTGVHPESRFGELIVKENKVIEFREKLQGTKGFISGGFFVMNKKFFDYLRKDDDCYFEQEPIRRLVREGNLNIDHSPYGKSLWGGKMLC